jgi:DNA-binding NarL/FixJ family response regulator
MNTKSCTTVLFVDEDLDEEGLIRLILANERKDRVIASKPDIRRIKLIAEQTQIDLILLAFLASKSFALYRQLGSIQSLRQVPVLLWRVPNPEVIHAEAQRLGVAGFVPLVFRPQDLLAARDAALIGDTYYPLT